MTDTTAGSARYVGHPGPSHRGRAAAHRARDATSTTSSLPGHAARALRAQPVRPGARSAAIDTAAALAAPGVRFVFTAADLNPGMKEQWHTSIGAAEPGDAAARRSPTTRCASSATRSRSSSPRAATSPRTRPSSSTSTTNRCRPSSTTRRPSTRTRSCTRSTVSNVIAALNGLPASDARGRVRGRRRTSSRETIYQQAYAAVPMEARGLVVDYVAADGRAHDLLGDAVARTRCASSAPGCSASPSIASASIMRDTGGGFGQKVLVQRDEMCLMLAAPKVGAPVKWIEDRRENLLAAGKSRHEHARRARLAFDADGADPGRVHRLRRRLRRVPDPVAGRRRGRGRACCSPARTACPRRLRDQDGLHEHRRAAPRTAGRGSSRRSPARCCSTSRPAGSGMDPIELRRRNVLAPDDLPYTNAERHDLRQHLPARDVRAGGGDARLRRIPRRAGRRARADGRLPRRRHVQLRRAVDARIRLLRAPRRRRSASSRRAR